MEMVNKLTEILKEKHGDKLNLKEDVYYLFLKGGLFTLYFDEDEKTVKVGVEFLPEESTFVYHSEENIEDYLEV